MNGGRRSNFYLLIGVGGLLFAVVGIALILHYAQLGAATKRVRERSDEKIVALVAVDPLAYLVERVGGERVVVSTLTPAGKDPESFAPTPAELAALASTRLFFCVGLPVEERFARNVASIAPESKSVDLREGLDLSPDPHSHSHSHFHSYSATEEEGSEAERFAPEALDPHLWTSPALTREIVAKIAVALGEESPKDAEFFARNAAELDAELAALQAELTAALAPFDGRTFVVFHPAYGYFAREFHLTQRAIEAEGKAPRPRDLAALIELARNERIRAAVVQPEFNRSSAESVARELGVGLIVHSPLEKDYFANLRALGSAVVAASTPREARYATDR